MTAEQLDEDFEKHVSHHTNGMVGSWTDWELSELGVEQAKKIGEKLKAELEGRNFVMYSSDLLRAKQTAEYVGTYLGLTPMLRPEYQGQGIGSTIIDMFLEYVEEHTPAGGRSSVQLIAEKGKEDFYMNKGFKVIPHEFCGSGMRKIVRK